MVDMEKTCKDCGITKDESLFRPKSRQCKFCRKKYLQEYERLNRDRRRSQKYAWAEANYEKSREIDRRTKRNNYVRRKQENLRRRAWLAGAHGSHTQEEWLAMVERYGNICLCCFKSVSLTRDHVVPLSLGGTDYIENIQPLCLSCNARKGNRIIIDYRVNFALG